MADVKRVYTFGNKEAEGQKTADSSIKSSLSVPQTA